MKAVRNMKRIIVILSAVMTILAGCGITDVSGAEDNISVSVETAVEIEVETATTAKPMQISETEASPAPTPAAVTAPTPAPIASPEPVHIPAPEQAPAASPEPVHIPAPEQAPAASPEPVHIPAPEQTSAASPDSVHICSWDEGTVTREANCTEKGLMTYTCTVCGATRTMSIEKTEHTYAWLWHLEEDLGYGNCMTRYRIVDMCAKCGYILNTYSDYTEPGHVLGEPVSEGGPHCTSVIFTTQTCLKCGEVFTNTVEPCGHVLETCGSGNCRFCGEHIEHQWAEGRCYCGAVQETSAEIMNESYGLGSKPLPD